jgi:DNA modification methylase
MPFAPYSDLEANDPALAHIHPGLRQLAVPIADVLLDPINVNTHPPEQVAVLKSLLSEFGQRLPLITRASTGVLEAGEGRILAARALGWRYVAVLPCEDDAITAMRFALADNRSPRLSVIDEDRLAEQLLALHEMGADLQALGWSEEEVGVLLDEASEGEDLVEPEAEEPPAVPWTRLGDVIELGPHRLICGDSTDPEVIERLMQGERADLVVTDPPYGVAYVGKSEDLAAERRTIANDNLGLEGTRDLVKRAAQAWPLRPGGVWYVCSASGDMETMFRCGLLDAGHRVRQQIVWVKNALVLSHFDYHYKHETVLYGWTDGAGHFWCGSRTEVSVWEVKKPARSADHPTMKPIELVAKAITNSSRRGEIVFDGFGGSGSTLVAAHQLGRRARLVELAPGFCDVIVRRARELGIEAFVDRPSVGRMRWGGESEVA